MKITKNEQISFHGTLEGLKDVLAFHVQSYLDSGCWTGVMIEADVRFCLSRDATPGEIEIAELKAEVERLKAENASLKTVHLKSWINQKVDPGVLVWPENAGSIPEKKYKLELSSDVEISHGQLTDLARSMGLPTTWSDDE